MKYIVIALLLAMSVGVLQAKEVVMSKQQLKTPQVWMAVLPADVLIGAEPQWDFVVKHVDGVKFWTQQIDDPAKDWPFQGNVDSPDALKKLIAILSRNHIPMIIEKGCWPQQTANPFTDKMGGKPGPFDDTYAQRAADCELERIKRVEALGGKVRYFDVDGPIRHMLYPVTGCAGFPTVERAAQEFAKYMVAVHRVYPDVEFFALTNFPNWRWKGGIAYPGCANWGDYYTAVTAIIRNAKKAEAPLRGITVDNPYDFAMGRVRVPGVKTDPSEIDWMGRILELERYVHSRGLEFNLIVNSSVAGETSSELFNKETLEFIDCYKKRGGKPDRYIVQSWYTHPTREEMLPETSPNTFTWLVKEVIKRVKGTE